MSSPLDFILDTCASTSSSHFFCWWSWTYVVCTLWNPFEGADVSSAKKTRVLQLGHAFDTKFLNLSHHVLSMDEGLRCGLGLIKNWGLAWWCDFLLWANLCRSPGKYSAKKRSSPLDFIFNTCASTSSSHFFGEAEHMCLYPFARANVSSPLQAFHGGIFLLVITFVIPESACEGFFVKKQPLYYIFTPSHLQI